MPIQSPVVDNFINLKQRKGEKNLLGGRVYHGVACIQYEHAISQVTALDVFVCINVVVCDPCFCLHQCGCM